MNLLFHEDQIRTDEGRRGKYQSVGRQRETQDAGFARGRHKDRERWERWVQGMCRQRKLRQQKCSQETGRED